MGLGPLLRIAECSHFLQGWQAHLFPSPRLLLMMTTAPKSSATGDHLFPLKTHPAWAPIQPGQHVCVSPRLCAHFLSVVRTQQLHTRQCAHFPGGSCLLLCDLATTETWQRVSASDPYEHVAHCTRNCPRVCGNLT